MLAREWHGRLAPPDGQLLQARATTTRDDGIRIANDRRNRGSAAMLAG
jgi:hypothetical protein